MTPEPIRQAAAESLARGETFYSHNLGLPELRVVPDRPAVLVVDKVHRRQQLPGRHFGLRPGFALVIGIENVPAIPDRHQAGAGVDDIEDQAFRGFGGFGGIDHIGRRLGGNHRCR